MALFIQQVDGGAVLQEIHQAIKDGREASPGYTIRDDLLLYKGKIVLHSTSTTIPLLLQEFDGSPTGGNRGALKPYQQAVREVYWKGTKTRIRILWLIAWFANKQNIYLLY